MYNFKLVSLGKLFILIIKYLAAPIIGSFRKILNRSKWMALSDKYGSIKLELGSGGRIGRQGWTTVDLGGSDISHDVTKKIPLPDNSVVEIYSSHLLEHLNFNQIMNLILDCKRLLVPGGKIRTAVPNAKLYFNAYESGIVLKANSEMYSPAVCNTKSLIDQINYIAYMNGEHKYLFDSQNLVNIFKIAGFSEVKLTNFDPEIDPFDRKAESIYCEARKC
jgi:predicted SAM-dependent methyltransferase